jgi:hypothetical protein
MQPARAPYDPSHTDDPRGRPPVVTPDEFRRALPRQLLAQMKSEIASRTRSRRLSSRRLGQRPCPQDGSGYNLRHLAVCARNWP